MQTGVFFGRSAKIQVARKGSPSALSLDGLRVVFDITKNKDENVAAISVFNISETTESFFVSGSRVTIEAGYEGREAVVFSGEIIETKKKISGPDKAVELTCREGATSLRSGVFSFSYGRGVSAFGVLRDLGARIGVPLDLSPELIDKPYANGWAFVGTKNDALREVSERVGGRVILYEGAVRIVSKDESVPASFEIVLSSPSSGLLGSPERFTEEEQGTELAGAAKSKKIRSGWNFSTLLDPRIVFGGLVQLSSAVIPGGSAVVTVAELKISGDTHGDAWKMDGKGYDRK